MRDGDKWARFEPFDGFKLDFTIDFPHPMFGSENRHVVIDFAEHSYVKEVARARTFGFMQDVEAMRAAGLALGGSLQNAIVLDEFRVLNSRGSALRQRVRQATKVLDAIGDLYLLGHPLIGQYTAYKSGHGLNNARRPRAAHRGPDAFELVTFAEPAEVPSAVPELAAFLGMRLRAGPSRPMPVVVGNGPPISTRAALILVRLLLFLALARDRGRRHALSLQRGLALSRASSGR